MGKPRTSAIIVTYNEADRIFWTLWDLSPRVDEIIVVDQCSTDQTREIAQRAGARVYIDHHYGYCEASRYKANFHATGEWIIVMDADERLTDKFSADIPALMASGFDGFRLQQAFVLDGDTKFVGGPHYRFFRKGYALFLDELHTEPQPIGSVGPTPDYAAFFHEKTLAEQLDDERRYETLIENANRPPEWKAGRMALNTYLAEARKQQG